MKVFEERWRRVMKNFQDRLRNDDGLKTLRKKYTKAGKRLHKIDSEISIRQTQILAEEVRREFADRKV